MKFIMAAVYVCLFLVLTNSEAFAADQPAKIRYFYCDATIAQKMKLYTGEKLADVLDKKTCLLASDTNIEDVYEQAQFTLSSKNTRGGAGIMSVESVDVNFSINGAKGTCDGEDLQCLSISDNHHNTVTSLFVFTKEQMQKLLPSISWSRDHGRDISLYFLKSQAPFQRRGEPDPLLMYIMDEKAQFVIEAH